MERAMFIPTLGFAVVAFILNSGVLGKPKRICALKGTSVDLFCSGEDSPNPKWYIRGESSVNWTEVSADKSEVKYKISNDTRPTLSVMDLKKEDKKFYCCKHDPQNCQEDQIALVVTALLVKVLPSTDGQTVTLTCSTTCVLSDKPAAYIWYKNQEVLYQDWSPWYQELVPSEKANRYSCAIKGLEVLRVPAVTVESVSSTCFTVSYADGRMCFYNQTKVKGPCIITYPTELRVVKNTTHGNVSLSCNTNCPPTITQWYKNRGTQNEVPTIPKTSDANVMCAVKGIKDLQSAEVCGGGKSCPTINYMKNRICALEGSSVNISSEYSCPNCTAPKTQRWSRINWNDEEVVLKELTGYFEYNEDKQKNIYTLTIKSVKQNDSAEYRVKLQGDENKIQKSGVFLIVTDVQVRFSPSAEVTEGQRVSLTCSTHCPLTHNKNYIWYLNRQLLRESQYQNKHLVLDPVRAQHAGNYSCSVTTQSHSPEKTLVVRSSSFQGREAAAVGVGAAALVFITLAVVCWIRGNRKLSKNTVLHLEETNPGHVYEEITDHSTEQNDSYYSSVLGPQADGNPLYNTVQPHQHQQETHIPYTVVSLGCHRCK